MIMMQNHSRGLRGFCRLLGFSAQAYYQYQTIASKRALEEDLLIRQVHVHRGHQPRLGARKLLILMQSFMIAHNISMGRDAFFGLLQANGLLIRKRRRNKPLTTFSDHWYKKYPDLSKGIVATRSDELWVSDITYVHLPGKMFAYLSLVTDAYSRKIIGFCLNPDLSANGPETALRMAIKGRTDKQPLVHHSDRGVQYCSDGYIKLLSKGAIGISMTQGGDPRDNAIAERVNGILKQELLKDIYPDIKQARQAVITAVDTYNRLRPHSSVDMMTPERAHAKTGAIRRRWKTKRFQQKKEAG